MITNRIIRQSVLALFVLTALAVLTISVLDIAGVICAPLDIKGEGVTVLNVASIVVTLLACSVLCWAERKVKATPSVLVCNSSDESVEVDEEEEPVDDEEPVEVDEEEEPVEDEEEPVEEESAPADPEKNEE